MKRLLAGIGLMAFVLTMGACVYERDHGDGGRDRWQDRPQWDHDHARWDRDHDHDRR